MYFRLLFLSACVIQLVAGARQCKANKFKVMVYTGNQPNAGTDANVNVAIYGENGTCNHGQLKSLRNVFERGRKDSFIITCPCIGRLKTLIIGHNNRGPRPGWYLNKVVIKNMISREKFVFMSRRWLAKDKGDGKWYAKLTVKRPTSKEPLPVKPFAKKPLPNCKANKFKVMVYTGTRPNAGTDANVFVSIFGENGSCNYKKLRSSRRNVFERGRKDSFTIVCPCIGRLKLLRIWHDNHGRMPGWYLNKVVIKNMVSREKFVFKSRRWLSKNRGIRKVNAVLTVKRPTSKKPLSVKPGVTPHCKDNKFKVMVYTGTRSGAGTDANVFVSIFGENGICKHKKLSSSKNVFEKGRKDLFTIVCPCIGRLKQLRIWHDNHGHMPGWYLKKVVIKNMVSREKFVFKSRRWLSKNRGDRKLNAVLTVKRPTSKKPLPVKPGVTPHCKDNKFKVMVYTGTRSEAGTDANVFVSLFGENGICKHKKLRSSRNVFEKGGKDLFTIVCPCIGRLKQLRIWHDNHGHMPGWYLKKVFIKNMVSREKFVFKSRRWLSKDRGDGKINAVLTVKRPTSKKPLPVKPGVTPHCKANKFKVMVYTGTRPNAGTDANVFVSLFGENGICKHKKLRSSKNVFKRGRKDSFTIVCPCIGRLKQLRIWHDNHGHMPGWYLKKVIIKNMVSREKFVFKSRRWLSKNRGDRKVTTVLTVKRPTSKKPLPVTPMPLPEKPVGEKPLPKIPDVKKPLPEKPVVEKPLPEKPVVEKPLPEKPVVEKPLPDKPFFAKPLPDKPVVEKPIPTVPVVEKPLPKIPVVEKPLPKLPVVEKPLPKVPVDEKPLPKLPVVEKPLPKIPDVEKPLPENPVVEKPLPEKPVVEKPLPEKPVVEKPLPEKPVVEKPLPEKPVVEKPLPEKPVVEKPLPEKPVVEKPLPKLPVVGKPLPKLPVVEKPLPKLPVVEKPLPKIPDVEKPLPDKPVVEKPLPEKPVIEKPLPKLPVVEKPLPKLPVVEKPLPKIPVVEKPLPDKPVVEKPLPEKPVIEKPLPKLPVVEKPLPKLPVVEKPLPKIPDVEKPLPEKPVVEKPLPEKPAVEKPLPEKPVVEKPLPEKPVVEKPLPKIPDVEKPLPNKPDVEKPLPEKPVIEKPLPKLPVVEKPLPKLPVVEKPLPKIPDVEKPLPEKPVVEKPLPEKPAVEKPLPEKPVVEKPLPEKPVVEKPLPTIPDVEKPLPEKPVVEKPLPEKPAVEKPLPEKPVVEKPLPEKPVVEKPLPKIPDVEKPLPEKPVVEKPLPACFIHGEMVKPGKFMEDHSTCTKYTCHVEVENPNNYKMKDVKFTVDHEILKDCFKEKCEKPGQMWTKNTDDKTFGIVCRRGSSGQLQQKVYSAGCVYGGSILEEGESFHDYMACIKFTCRVKNIGRDISKVKFRQETVSLKDC